MRKGRYTVEQIIDKACNYGRVGYRMVTHMLRNEGVTINLYSARKSRDRNRNSNRRIRHSGDLPKDRKYSPY